MTKLKVGDKVRALKKVWRVGGGSIMNPGSYGVITSVWENDNCQIVGVRPDDVRQKPMIDIVCMFDKPPVFEAIKETE